MSRTIYYMQMKRLLTEWKNYLNENESNELYVNTEFLQKYDFGAGSGDDQLYNLLISGVFTVEELGKIFRDLQKEYIEFNQISNLINKNVVVIFDEYYPQLDQENSFIKSLTKRYGDTDIVILQQKANIINKNYMRVFEVFRKAYKKLSRDEFKKNK